MNILYISNLRGNPWAGPAYSVPMQIASQSKIDNVFWLNNSVSKKTEWKDYCYYHDITEYPESLIHLLPKPFNNPDLIVIEQLYNVVSRKQMKELSATGIPYIIIPRGELTKKAQKRKRLKKGIANILFYKKFIREASAIQFLTEQELIDSGTKWNKKSIVIPNGITMPDKKKASFSMDCIKCVSIGRIEPYQKGLDLLINACSLVKNELKESNCMIQILGPDSEGKKDSLVCLIKSLGLSSFVEISDAVYGKDKEKVLLENDVFLITSRFEGHPMTLIEALSYGIPSLVTTGSNMSKEINSFDAGWVANNDVESIAHAIRKMINEKNSFIDKSANACKLASEYTWERVSSMSHAEYSTIPRN